MQETITTTVANLSTSTHFFYKKLLSHKVALFFVSVALLCIVPVVTVAQGGSDYTVFGFGDMRQNVGAAFDGLGGSAYGVSSDYVISTVNPAAWSLIRTTRVQGGYRFNQNQVSYNDQSTAQNNGKLDGAMVLFALDTGMAISACIGLAPTSSVNYYFKHDFSMTVNGNTVNGSSYYQGSGSMVTAYFGGGARVMENVYAGICGMVHFGSISDNIEHALYTEDSFSSLNRRRDELSAAGVRLGILAEPLKNLKIGAALSTNGNLSYSLLRNYRTTGTSIAFDSTFTEERSSPMPTTFGFGASYISGKFLFAADAEFQSFGDVTYRLQPNFAYTNASRFSVGISRLGVQSAGTAYVDRMNFNIGAGIRSLYYTVNGTPISEQYASFGVQMPFGGAAMVDAALTAGMRGTTSNALVQEQFLRFSFAISVGETWFVPFKRE